MSQSQPSLEIETTHTLLANGVRRAVLEILHSAEAAPPEELASRLASGHDLGADALGDADSQTITVALIHTHLPKLDAYDVVDYSGLETDVTRGENFDDLVSVLDRFDQPPSQS